jgi:hypothetical protein
MTIIIPKNASVAEVELQLKKTRKRSKGFDAAKYAGTVKWEKDPLAYQNEVRGE